jgi:ankyrin repeat protein
MADQEKIRQQDLLRDLNLAIKNKQSLDTVLKISHLLKPNDGGQENDNVRQSTLRNDLDIAMRYGISQETIVDICSKIKPSESYSEFALQQDLILAINIGQSLDVIRMLCSCLKSLDYGNSVVNCPLYLACVEGNYNPDLIRLLVEMGADVNKRNGFGLTPLLILARFGALDMIKYLIGKGANWKQDESSFLSRAMNSGVPEMVKYAEELVKKKDQAALQADLITAIKEKKTLEEISKICDKLESLNFGNSIHNNPLLMVSTYGTYREDLVKLFVERGADVNTREESCETTPIIYLTAAGRLEMVKFLVEKGANYLTANKYGNNIISASKGSQKPEMVKFVEELLYGKKKDEKTLQNEIFGEVYTAINYKTGVDTIRKLCNEFRSSGFSLNFGKNHHTSPMLLTCSSPIYHDSCNEVLQLLVEYGADVNYKSEHHTTPIMYAAQAGNLDAVKFLIAKGADPKYVPSDKPKYTLHRFAKQSKSKEMLDFVLSLSKTSQESLELALLNEISNKPNMDVVRDICSKLKTLNFGKNHYDSPLIMACVQPTYNEELIRLLVELGADVNYRSAQGTTPIMYLAQFGNLRMLIYLVENGADTTVTSTEGYNLEYYAKYSGSKGVMEYVSRLMKGKQEIDEDDEYVLQPRLLDAIKRNADLEVVKTIAGRLKTLNFGDHPTNSPLLMVCDVDHFNPDLIQLFVERGADVNYQSFSTRTPIVYLALNGALEMMKYLVSKGANPHVETRYGYRLDYYAKDSRVPEVIAYVNELLSKVSSTMSQKQLEGRLLKAIKNNDDFDKIKEICGHLKSLDFGTDEYDSPLFMVCSADHFNPDLIKLFVEMGANVNYQPSHSGITAIMYLAYIGALDMVKYLVSVGANPHGKTKHGSDLLTYANRSDVKDMIDYAYEILGRNGEKLQKDLLNAIKSYKDIDEIKALCSAVGDLNFGDDHTSSPLLMVCVMETFNPDLIRLFVEMGANVNYQSSHGSTPIMYLAEFGALEMVKYLVGKGADYKIRNARRNDIVYYAKLSGVQEMFQYASDLVDGKVDKPTVEPVKSEQMAIDVDTAKKTIIEPVIEPVLVEQIILEPVIEHSILETVVIEETHAEPIVIEPITAEQIIVQPTVVEQELPKLPESDDSLVIEENFIKPPVSNIFDNEIKENFIN